MSLIEIEIEYEKNNLRLDKNLYNAACDFCRNGGSVFIISDMYFHKENIAELLDYFCQQRFYKKIYVSCEFSAAKKTGLLFDIFLQAENIKADQLLHIGDNSISDSIAPRKKGIYTCHKPRSWGHRVLEVSRRKYCRIRERRYLQ